MMEKTILFNLLIILLLTSCTDDNNNELEKDIEQITIEKVLGNTYYCEEQNSTIEFISYNKYENTPYGKQHIVDCIIYGDVAVKVTGKEIVNTALYVRKDIISNRSPNKWDATIEFKILDENLLIGSLKAQGNWVRK